MQNIDFMYFEIANIQVNPCVPPLVAFIISFFTSMGGVSGAFLLLPFQMSFLGYTNPSVSATNQLFNVIAIPSGVYRYYKERRMVWPLTWIVIIGTSPGVFLGVFIRAFYLPNPKHFKLFAAAVLLYIGIKMISGLLIKNSENSSKANIDKLLHEKVRQEQLKTTGNCVPLIKVTHLNFKRLGYTFYDEAFDVSSLGIFSLSLIVGVVGGIYGIGGGAIMAPFFVSIFGLPIYTVAGAALMGTFVTSIAGVIFYQGLSLFYPTLLIAPDWILGGLFGLGGMGGMYCGARCQKFFPASKIKWMLAFIINITAIKYIFEFLDN